MLKSFYRNNENCISSKEGEIKMYKEIQNFTKVITTEFAGAVKGEKKAITSPLTPLLIEERGEINITSPSTPLLIKERGGEDAQQSIKNNCKYLIEGELKMLKIKSNRKTAFTLAETLITVVILGILAAILVPNLIKNQVENANRTKVKKAMAAYEKAINFMIVENDIKSTETLRELGQGNCQYTREYFKTVQDGSNNCIFKTADKVWWDITDITNPIISLKDEITDANAAAIANNALSLEADKTSFALIGRFDEIGTLRVNDNAYEQGLSNNSTNQAYMIKLWHFINNSNSLSSKEQFATCKATGVNTCTITVDGKEVLVTLLTLESDNNIIVPDHWDKVKKTYVAERQLSTAKAGEYWIYDMGKTTSNAQIQEGVTGPQLFTKCVSLGGHPANMAEVDAANKNNLLKQDWYYAPAYFNDDLSYNASYYFPQGEGEYKTGHNNGIGNIVLCLFD